MQKKANTKLTKSKKPKLPSYSFLITLALIGIFAGLFLQSDKSFLPPSLTLSDATAYNDILVKARGKHGKEKIALSINGQSVMSWDLSKNWSNYVYKPKDAVTANTVSVHFINDGRDPVSGANLDVQIDYIKVNGKVFQTEHSTTKSIGSWNRASGCAPGKKQSEWLHCRGSFTYNVPKGTIVGVQTPVIGRCGTATQQQTDRKPTRGLCATGQASVPTEDTASNVWRWHCAGLYGGSTQACSVSKSMQQNDSTLTAPVPGMSFSGSSQKFVWTDGGNSNRVYDVHVGSRAQGDKYFDLDGKGVYNQEGVTVNGLPTDGSEVVVTLIWSDDQWNTNYRHVARYTAYDAGNGIKGSQITSPASGSVFVGSTQKFTWTDGGNSKRLYDLHVGSTKGSQNIYDLQGGGAFNQESHTVTNLPTDGSRIYVKLLWSDDNWVTNQFTEYQYSTQKGEEKESGNNVIDTADIVGNTFSDEKLGAYSDVRFKADRDWGKVQWANFRGRTEIVSDNGNKELRVKFPKGVYGHAKTGGNSGIPFTPQDEIYQRMTVHFEKGYSFAITGKIVGIGSDGANWTGGAVPKNGEGYSSRFIWDKAHQQPSGQARAAIYLYHKDQRSIWGDQEGLGFNFKTGVDYTLTQRIKRNRSNNADGILQIWVSENGGPHRLVMHKKNMRWGLNGNGKADMLMVSPFHGGSGSKYAPHNDSYMRLDDIAVSTKKFSDLP